MVRTDITTDNAVFVLLSFEGPDIYSQAGGLGVRVTNLSQTLARAGFTTHLFFIGDPRFPGEEAVRSGKLILHRWCQWISAYHTIGCYHGESEKHHDYTESIPPYLMEHIIKPALIKDKMVIIMAEEWHTAEAVAGLHNLLSRNHMRDNVILFWNANNIFGFDHINFKRLDKACTITTVSRYMKHIMWRIGLNPIVIPNGIPKALLNRVDPDLSAWLRHRIVSDLVLTKIARWDPDKRWNMAVEATARLKARGMKTTLVARGGIEGYGEEIIYNARSLGLRVKDIASPGTNLKDYLEAVAANSAEYDFLNLKFHCPQDFLRLVYHISNAVLANSGREPFGLVGLETMAAGGVAFTGNTGEDYAIPFQNSIVLETSDPKEIESYVMYLMDHPEDNNRIRNAGRSTAAKYTWEQAQENLFQRLEYQAKLQGLITLPQRTLAREKEPVGIFNLIIDKTNEIAGEMQPA
jgi:glycosyltransferase involved in cell wall biosynthesis